MVVQLLECITYNMIAEIDFRIVPRCGEIVRIMDKHALDKAYRVERVWHWIAREQRVTVERGVTTELGEATFKYVYPTCLCTDVTDEYEEVK